MADLFFAPCPGYDDSLPSSLLDLFSLSGIDGVALFSGKRVLLKPNLLTDRPPEAAVTTHPVFLRAVIRLFQSFHAVVTVGDSPASTANLRRVWQITGVEAVCREEGVPLISFEEAGSRAFSKNGFSFSLANPVLDADWIVNLPKVKSHGLTALTAAVKNLYGAVPGYAKTYLHKKVPRSLDFGKLLESIWSCLPQSLTIVDGVVGMEGQGPANGRPVSLGFLALGFDPFAMDAALCTLLKINPKNVPYLNTSHFSPAPVIHGKVPQLPPFEIPSGVHLLQLLPSWVVKTAGSVVWIRPAFLPDSCVGCGKCLKACPVGALSFPQSPKSRLPVLNPRRCISCACCHEVCPQGAIRMRQSPLLKMMKVFRGLD